MVRIQLHLAERHVQRLGALARKRGVTRAQLIRQGIELLLSSEKDEADPLLDLIGAAGPAGRTDLSERHDELLYDASPDRLPAAAEPDEPAR